MCERIFWDGEEIETQGQFKAKLGDKAKSLAQFFDPEEFDEYCLCPVDIHRILTICEIPFETDGYDYFVPKDAREYDKS